MSRKKLKAKYNVEIISARDGFSVAKNKETDLYGLLDNNKEEIIIPFEYKFIDVDFSKSELILAENRDGLYGFINRKNEITIPFEYEFAYNFLNGFAIAVKNYEENYEGIIDELGNVIIPIRYDEIYILHPKKYAKIKENGKYGLMNFESEIILTTQYDFIDTLGYFASTLVLCEQNEKFGIFDFAKREFIIPIEIDHLEDSLIVDKDNTRFEYYVLTKNDHECLIILKDNKIKYLTEFIYDHIDHTNISEGIIRIKQNGSWGAADINCNIIIPCKYEEIFYANNGKIKAVVNNQEYWFNLEGNLIL